MRVYIEIPRGESYSMKWRVGELVLHQGDAYRIVDVVRDAGGLGWPPAPRGVWAELAAARRREAGEERDE